MTTPVKIYTKEGCPFTRGLQRRLEQDGLPYVTCDVLRDPAQMQEMLSLNGGRRAVPTSVWPDGDVQVGFQGS